MDICSIRHDICWCDLVPTDTIWYWSNLVPRYNVVLVVLVWLGTMCNSCIGVTWYNVVLVVLVWLGTWYNVVLVVFLWLSTMCGISGIGERLFQHSCIPCWAAVSMLGEIRWNWLENPITTSHGATPFLLYTHFSDKSHLAILKYRLARQSSRCGALVTNQLFINILFGRPKNSVCEVLSRRASAVAGPLRNPALFSN